MRIKTLAAAVLAVATLGAASAANASLTFVGSWLVSDGPYWDPAPTAYSGQEAAALLFGGSASDYSISTVDNLAADVNFSAWVSTWGSDPACSFNFPCGTVVAQDSEVSTGGLYATPGDTSAYVTDWAVGEQFRNYAFTGTPDGVPEAATWTMMIAGFGLAGASLRRRRAATA